MKPLETYAEAGKTSRDTHQDEVKHSLKKLLPAPNYCLDLDIKINWLWQLATEDEITISDQNQIFFHTNESFKIIHLNAQSATNKVDELSLLCEEARPAVLVISEHSLTDQTIS